MNMKLDFGFYIINLIIIKFVDIKNDKIKAIIT